MKKTIGIIFLVIGAFGFIGIFFSKAGPPTLEHGIAYFLGRLSPLLFLVIGYVLVKEKKKAKNDSLSQNNVNDSKTFLSNQVETNSKDINFLDEFSEKQKAAMIYSLMLLSSANGKYDDEKIAFTDKQANILSLNMESGTMINQMEKKADYAYSIIKKFSTKQKDWYSVLLGSGLCVGGRPTDKEKAMVKRILDESEITYDQFNNSNELANVIVNKLIE